MDRTTRHQVAGTGLFLVLVAMATIALSPTRILAWLSALGSDPVAFGLALAGLYAVRPAFAWPISPISALVGYVLGITYGVPVALVGATVTCLPPFFLSRYAGRTGGLFGRLNDAGREVVEATGATRGVLAARLSPLPADPVSYGAGVAGVSTPGYVLGTLTGEIPWVIVEVTAGASMREVTTHGLGAGVHLLVVAFAASLLLLAGPAYRHAIDRQPS
jgi:uncharacterized membrane protein YdjX (TVP38/TMEM64 family)